MFLGLGWGSWDLGAASLSGGLPRWLSGKESICQCSRRGFSTWDGKIPWRWKQKPTPVFLLGKSCGQRILAGHSPWGYKELDKTEQLHLSKKAIEHLVSILEPTLMTSFELNHLYRDPISKINHIDTCGSDFSNIFVEHNSAHNSFSEVPRNPFLYN